MRRSSRRKNSTKIFVATTLIIAVTLGVFNYFFNKTNETLIATVNGQKIFKSEIERKLNDVFSNQEQDVKSPDVAKLPKDVLEILAKEIYLEKELTKEAKKSNVAKDEELKQKIKDVKNKILRQAYINSVIKEEISEQKINDKYAELTNEVNGKKEYLIAHIVVKDKSEAEKLLKEIKKAKKSSAEFDKLAKKYSIDKESAENGGKLGYVLENNLVKEISDAVTTLKKGQISEPIQTKFGWHLVKVEDARNATLPSFETVKDNIRNQLIQDKLNEINSKFIKDAKVQILLKDEVKEENKDELKEEQKEEAPATVEEEKVEEKKE